MTTEDITAIEQLVAHYNMAIDDGAGDEYSATFTDDGELVLPDATIAGREALVAFGPERRSGRCGSVAGSTARR